MISISCTHHSKITMGNGFEQGECIYCHQVTIYKKGVTGEGKAKITRLGRINGNIVIPDNGMALDLSEADAKDLGAVDVEDKETEQRTLDPTPRSKPRKEKETRIHYDERVKNKEAMIQDYYSLTLMKFLKKWQLSTNTWQKLKLKWGVKSKKKALENVNMTANTDPPGVFEHDLPPFNEAWGDAVKVKWLEVWLELRRLK